MKKIYLPILLCLLITIPFIIGCSIPPASTSSSSSVTSLTTRLADAEAVNKTQQEALDKQQQSINELYEKKLSKSEYTGSADTYPRTELYTRAEVEQKIANAIASLKNDQSWISPSSSSSSSSSNPSGQVTYRIDNPQPYYQITDSYANTLIIKVFNNKPDARYIRPQFTISPFGNAVPGTVSSADCNIVSSSMGGSLITFLTAIAGNTVLMTSTGGGTLGTGEILLASGVEVTLYVQFKISSASPALWTLTVSGTDRPIS